MSDVSERVLADCEQVHGFVGRICFKKGPPAKVGAELEWLVAPAAGSHLPVTLDDLRTVLEAAGSPPAGSIITYEPGGQLELSSPAADGVTDCWRLLERDVAHVRAALAAHDLALLPVAYDPHRRPVRQLRSPRYDAMQTYFDARGPAGLAMMTVTAATQVNLDAGVDDADIARRWRLLQALGPVLIATFANSPLADGRPTGWKSTRQQVVQQLERAAPVVGDDPRAAWTEYALTRPVMLVRRPDRWMAAPGFTFADWVDGRAGLPRPTEEDLAYHLSTLFPPVRPRGWLEVRYIDAQDERFWPVPVAVVAALLADLQAADAAEAAAEPVRDSWSAAARCGLADPALARAATSCLSAAIDALRKAGEAPELLDLVAEFAERYTDRGLCPADERGLPR